MEAHPELLTFPRKVVTSARKRYDAAWFPCTQRDAVNSAKEIRGRRNRTAQFVSDIRNGLDTY